MNNNGIIRQGDVQWMTVGSGIIHQEMPKGRSDGLMWGFQLWANLPATHKMMVSRYREVKSSQIPEVSLDEGAVIRVMCGEIMGAKGLVHDIITDPEYLDIAVPANGPFEHTVKPGHTIVVYVIEGEGYFDEKRDAYAFEVEGRNYFDLSRDSLIGGENLIVFTGGDRISAVVGDKGVRFLLMSGKPIREPVAWYGPIVMNTR
jgi:hypothetical protein